MSTSATFWYEEWRPKDEDDGYGTSLDVRAEVLDLGDSAVEAVHVKVVGESGQELACRLSLEDGESLAVFLAEHLPEMRRRVEARRGPDNQVTTGSA